MMKPQFLYVWRLFQRASSRDWFYFFFEKIEIRACLNSAGWSIDGACSGGNRRALTPFGSTPANFFGPVADIRK